ncbi:hypothetical protein B0T25DRAFT_576878 [Lasiosphaeria hispida]|uniref:Uncharacterized protein n=1 Tax=Lasiosphaeria hispida TaxID=260671 RepID=A0AAJ0HY06_9PEZI|nr:hypothetical protein B0T25DRAFT_576878 [Lasiosphaeria hispida]
MAANAAVREQRRRSTPLDIEQMNIMKALTAAEYSRRQFVLNFAASRDTRLLIPGQKADAIKEAEEWAVVWLNKNGYETITNEFFKYTVDARLWATLVGTDVGFPFSFMRRAIDDLTPTSSTDTREAPDSMRPMSEIWPAGYEIEVRHLDRVLSQRSQPNLLPARRPSKHMKQQLVEQQQQQQQQQQKQQPQPQPQQRQRAQTEQLPTRRPSKHLQQHVEQPAPSQPAAPQRTRSSRPKKEAGEKRRSIPMYSFEDLKETKKLTEEKFPLLVRLGRSFSRRLSG